jgi:hypothetical protein
MPVKEMIVRYGINGLVIFLLAILAVAAVYSRYLEQRVKNLRLPVLATIYHSQTEERGVLTTKEVMNRHPQSSSHHVRLALMELVYEGLIEDDREAQKRAGSSETYWSYMEDDRRIKLNSAGIQYCEMCDW